MITPSARTQSELQKKITEPAILCDLVFGPTIYISTRGPITYDGIVYQAAQFDVAGIELGDYGEQRATVRISPAFVDTILNPGVIDKPVKLQMVWGQEPFNPGDAIELHYGVVSSVNISQQWIDLQTTQINSNAVTSPRYYYDHENIQPSGTLVQLWGRTIEIRRSDYS